MAIGLPFLGSFELIPTTFIPKATIEIGLARLGDIDYWGCVVGHEVTALGG